MEGRARAELALPLYVDQRALPLLQLRYVGDYSDDELQQFLQQMDAVLKLPGKKAGIVDLSDAVPGTAKQRRVHAEWIADRKPLLQRDFVAAAIVTDSAIIRGTVTAIFWIAPLPLPTHVTASMEQAEGWLEPYLAGLTTAR